MPISKYTPEVVQEICDAIAVHGIDKAGYDAVKISGTTFHDWLKKYPEFAAKVSEARCEFRKIKLNSLKRSANKAFHDYVTGSMVRTESTITYHPDGDRTEVVKSIPIGIPRWAIERVLGQPIEELEAITALAEKEIIPKWIAEYAQGLYREIREKIASAIRGELPEHEIKQWIEAQQQVEASTDGISDQTWAEIRRAVMGIQEQQRQAGESSKTESVETES
jgi:hypothetical protein